MKLPNGYGSVTKLSGKRRKPFCVKVTCGYTDDGKQIRKIIDYVESRTEGYQLLAEYHRNPYNIDIRKITFEKIYDEWLTWKKNSGVSGKSISRYTNAFKYYKELYKKSFIEINLLQVQKVIDQCLHGYFTKSDIKILYCQLYEYAKLVGLPIQSMSFKYLNLGPKTKSELHGPFSEEEISILWDNMDIEYVDLILIDIYTGMRPIELINPTEIHLEDKYMIAGVKTDAGIDRIIPLHEKILNLVKKVYVDNKIEFTYIQYSKRFKKVMDLLKMNHTPYDCRHTFATRMDNVGANKLCIKKIMGHSISDITDNVYTHKDLSDLLFSVNLLK